MLNQFEVGTVGSNQTSTMGTNRQSNQNIKMEIAKLFGGETFRFTDLRQKLP